jgi:hypothetical protein
MTSAGEHARSEFLKLRKTSKSSETLQLYKFKNEGLFTQETAKKEVEDILSDYKNVPAYQEALAKIPEPVSKDKKVNCKLLAELRANGVPISKNLQNQRATECNVEWKEVRNKVGTGTTKYLTRHKQKWNPLQHRWVNNHRSRDSGDKSFDMCSFYLPLEEEGEQSSTAASSDEESQLSVNSQGSSQAMSDWANETQPSQ